MPPSSRRAPKERPELPELPDDPARFDAAVSAFEKRVPMVKDEWESLLEEEKAFAFTVADVAQADLVTYVHEAILDAVERGTTFEDFKGKVGDLLEDAWGGEQPGRLETIFRTNVQTALNEGRYAMQSSPAMRESRPMWRFEAIDDDRLDDECAPFADLIVPADDDFWADHYPPLHYNCRCIVTALEVEEAEEDGAGRMDEPPDLDAAEGFGKAPSEDGEDWKPDPSSYPEGIGDALADRIDSR